MDFCTARPAWLDVGLALNLLLVTDYIALLLNARSPVLLPTSLSDGLEVLNLFSFCCPFSQSSKYPLSAFPNCDHIPLVLCPKNPEKFFLFS